MHTAQSPAFDIAIRARRAQGAIPVRGDSCTLTVSALHGDGVSLRRVEVGCVIQKTPKVSVLHIPLFL